MKELPDNFTTPVHQYVVLDLSPEDELFVGG